MKTSCFVFALLASTLTGVQAQVAGNGANNINSQGTLPPPTAYSVVANDANSRIWERTVYEQGPNRTIVPRKSRYTELSSGLNYRDPNTGEWTPSREQIDLLPPGGAFAAAATHGQHSARFPLDIAQGVIQLSGPDGKQLQSRPVGLFYEDDSNSALIAILTNSVGGLVGSNEVVYPDAFEGAAASLHYKYTRVGFEQDVVVQEQLPDPAALGLNPARTRLGVLTAFFDNNNPVATPGPVDAAEGLSDTALRFGTMTMTKGRAFSIGNAEQSPSFFEGTPTYKRWFQLNGHNFLMEEVPYHRVAAQLEQLPAATGRIGIIATNLFAANSILNGVSAKPLPPSQLSKSGTGNRKPEMTRLSRAGWDKTPALVLDYEALNSDFTDYTFQGDMTYYITGTVNLYGTNTFEGGTVIKFTNNYDVSIQFQSGSVMNCQGSAYRPIVITSMDDNSVGETISGSTGNPASSSYYTALSFQYTMTSQTLSHIRVAYASLALAFIESDSAISDAQFVNCGTGLEDVYSTVTLKNALFSNMQQYDVYQFWPSDYFTAENVTFDRSPRLCYDDSNPDLYLFAAINCIVANVTDTSGGNSGLSGDHNGFYNSPPFGTSTFTNTFYPFQTAGAGAYYLTNGCGFQAVGTANIDPVLLANLATKTTQPPIVYSNITFTIATNFAPQAYRDNSGNAVDLGYHYDPIDYCFGGVTAKSNVTFAAGTAAGWFELPGSQGNGYGISITNGKAVNFSGALTNPCWFARYSCVQEGGNGYWTDKSYPGGIVNQTVYNTNNPAGITAVFTRFLHLAGDPNHFRDGTSNQPIVIQAKNCEFYGGAVGRNMLAGYTNCLFYRAGFGISNNLAYPYQKYINCTFFGGSLNFGHSEGGAPYWYSYIHDCAFDGTTFSIDNPFGSNTNYADYNYNAFNSGAAQPPTEGANTVSVTGGFNWQSSWFGNYYQPTNSLLIDAGDRTADMIGLFHFAQQTNQTIEGFSTVDIGYHYVATDASGSPLDSNGDGIPDYIEDANGNGLIDNGETPWTNDSNLDGLTAAQNQLYGANPNVSLGFGIWLAEPLLFGIP